MSVGRLFSSFISTFNVLLRGPSSFFAMSNFIITSRSTVFASARAHDPLSRSSPSPGGGTSDASPLRRRLKVCKNSARFDASFRARFRARRSEMDLLIYRDSVSLYLRLYASKCVTHCDWRTGLCALFDADIIQLSFFQRPFRWTCGIWLCLQQSLDHYGFLSHYRTSTTLELSVGTYRDARSQIVQCIRHYLSLPVWVHNKNVGF